MSAEQLLDALAGREVVQFWPAERGLRLRYPRRARYAPKPHYVVEVVVILPPSYHGAAARRRFRHFSRDLVKWSRGVGAYLDAGVVSYGVGNGFSFGICVPNYVTRPRFEAKMSELARAAVYPP